jgi:hypothetical protein
MVMQVLVIAVQNTAPHGDLGVATSSSMLFRLIGGSLGTAALGAIFTNRVMAGIAGLSDAAGAASARLSPQMLAQLPTATRALYAHAFANAIDLVFVVATAVSLVSFLLCWKLPALPLRETVHTHHPAGLKGRNGAAH